jgi:nucleoside-diphosphate-sugar epimerase
MRVLVTGHLGYVGTVMTSFLAGRGHEVAGLDLGWFEPCLLPGQRSEAPPARRLDIRAVQPKDLQGFDAVIHLAALSNDPLGDVDPELTRAINLDGTLNVARAAKGAGVPRFVFSSSCSVYGAAGDEALDESATFNPVTAYGRSKVESEAGLARIADDDFSPTYMRWATAFGLSPRHRLDLVLNSLTAAAYTTGKVLLVSDGTPWRPILHVEDMARAAAAVLEAPREAIHDEPFNVGSDAENYRIRALAEIVAEVVPGSEVEIAPGAGPDKRTYRVDFGKIHRVLPEFRPRWSARDGARQMVEAYRAAKLSQEDFDGPRYVRLRYLRDLLSAGRLDESLAWSGQPSVS